MILGAIGDTDSISRTVQSSNHYAALPAHGREAPSPTILSLFVNGTHHMSPIFRYDLFLSHSSKDKEVVRPLAERLRGDGVRVWNDEWEIKPGDSIPARIEAGLI